MLLNGPALFESYSTDRQERSHVFARPVDEVVATEVGQVQAALTAVEQAVERGLHAAGFICYEAATGLDRALQTAAPGELPLVYFGLFATRESPAAPAEGGDYVLGAWRPSVDRAAYEADIGRIRDHIAAGDTYQVNYTLRLRSEFAGDPRGLYHNMCRAQQAAYCAYIDLGRHVLLSAAPELFFRVQGKRCTTRPMKGTRRRGRWPAEDLRLAEELRQSVKDRAENVMVTDLLRNDLGRISQVGSVEVRQLWATERYPTLWQLTSTVESNLRAGFGLAELATALFPCGSITGAPKVRTMEIIAELEREPRGIYTGCIGYISPGGEACFNVAIRTAHLDREKGQLEFGVGGGITWGSSAAGEYAECLVKAQILHARRPEFELLETLRCEKGVFYLLDRHCQRLAAAAAYWDFALDRERVIEKLEKSIKGLDDKVLRVRLTLSRKGEIAVQVAPLSPLAKLRVALAVEKVDSTDPFLYHKTTHRVVYERQLAARPECDDVLLYNERGELTECCIGNLVLEWAGQRYTPPVAAGLLAGTFREELLARGEIRERALKIDDLARADALYLINSVRRWVELELV